MTKFRFGSDPQDLSDGFLDLDFAPAIGEIAIAAPSPAPHLEATLLAPAASVAAPLDASTLASLTQGLIDHPVTSSAVGAQGATAAQVRQALNESGLSVDGTGIKVGVISNSFNHLGGAAADEASGALPGASSIQVIKDLSSGGTDEGRAMMQIVHEIAPGASLAFYTAAVSEQDFANGILALAAAGCKVICDDVSYFDEPFFQNGVVAQAIQTVEAEGVTYITSAGNNAGNAYQSAWTPISGTLGSYYFSDATSFGGSLTLNITVTASASHPLPLLLEWNQPYGAATADLVLYVFQNGNYVASATNRSVGEPTNPWTGLQLTASGTYQIVIDNISSIANSDPTLFKLIAAGNGLPVTISGANVGTVYGHAMTPGVITAGAVSAASTPAFGVDPPLGESFSSSGAGTMLLFANDGTALSSPELLSPVAVSGLDDIATTLPGGLADFYGTSAASASLAGVAALMLAANPALTSMQVEQIMEATATAMANPAVSGAGLVNVDAAVAAAAAFVVTVASHVATHAPDFNADGKTDLLFFNNSTQGVAEWELNGAQLVAGPQVGLAPSGFAYADKGDFDGNGTTDLLFVNSATHVVQAWLMNGTQVASSGTIGTINAAGGWSLADVGDFNGDGKTDLLFLNSTTKGVAEWQLNGTQLVAGPQVGVMPSGFHFASTGDFNGDGKTDLLMINDTTHDVSVWEMNGTQVMLSATVGTINAAAGWHFAAVGDFNGDGKTDLFFLNDTTHGAAVWLMNGSQISAGPQIGVVNAAGGWSFADVGDFNGDGKSDLLFLNSTTGGVAVWQIDGTRVTDSPQVGVAASGDGYSGLQDVNGDHKSDILFENASTHALTVWEMNGTQVALNQQIGTINVTGGWHLVT